MEVSELKEWSTERLVEEHNEQYEIVDKIKCFGKFNLRLLLEIENELTRRENEGEYIRDCL